MYPDGGGLYLRVTPEGAKKLGTALHARSTATLDGAWSSGAIRPSGSPRDSAGRAPQATRGNGPNRRAAR